MDSGALDAVIGGVLAIGGGLLGGMVTGWYTLMSNKQSLEHESKREERERQLSFRREQLEMFYGPILACMEELEECWYLLFEAERSVQEFLARHRGDETVEGVLQSKQTAVLAYKQYLYDREVTVFNRVKEIFVEKFGLAEPSTKEKYRAVVRFIENRNIIRVTEKQLDLTFTGEDASGIRDELALLFDNLVDLSARIRRQIELGDPRPLEEDDSSRTHDISAGAASALNLEKAPSYGREESTRSDSHDGDSTRHWAGRYTLLKLQALEQSAVRETNATADGEKSDDDPETSNAHRLLDQGRVDADMSPGKPDRRSWPGRYTILTDSGRMQQLGEQSTKPPGGQ